MPVPNSMADLATLASSNFPTGTEAIGNSLDNYIRAISAIIRSTNAIASATIASASTTDIALADGESVTVTGSATINSLGTGFVGCYREVRYTGAPTIVNSSNIILPGGVNTTVSAGDVHAFRCTASGVWALVSSSRDVGALRRSGDTATGNLGISSGTPTFTFNDISASTTARILSFSSDLYIEGPANRTIFMRGFGGTSANVVVSGKVTANTSFISSAGDCVIAPSSASGYVYLRPKGEFDGSAQIIADFGGNLTATGNLISNSDERLKERWKPLAHDLVESFAGLRAGAYTRRDTGAEQVGVGAQSLQKFLPLAVSEDPNGVLSVAYGNAALVGVVAVAKRLLELERRFEER